MKRLSLLIPIMLVLFVFTNQCTAQNVPAKVKQAFSKKFPNVQNVNWGKENATEYEAEFTLNGKEASANFDTDGNWKETEMTIAENDLPYPVKQTLSRDYKEAKVMHAYEITSTGETTYEVEVQMDEDHEMKESEENEEMEENEEKGEEHGEMDENDESGHSNVHELVFTKDGKVVNKKKMEEDEEGEY